MNNPHEYIHLSAFWEAVYLEMLRRGVSTTEAAIAANQAVDARQEHFKQADEFIQPST